MTIRAQMLMCDKVTHNNLIGNSPLFRSKQAQFDIYVLLHYNED